MTILLPYMALFLAFAAFIVDMAPSEGIYRQILANFFTRQPWLSVKKWILKIDFGVAYSILFRL